METLFIKLLNMSITATWLVLAVVVLRVIFKRAPKFITVILWGFVALRLVCPFSFKSVLSLIPSAQTVPNDIMYAKSPQIYSGISSVNTAVNNIVMPQFYPDPANSANPLQIALFIASIVWLIGIAIMLLYTVISYFLIHRKVSAAIQLEDNIFLCDHITTPFILGIIKPRIYMPSGIDDAYYEYVIAHEKSHIKRRDHWWKPLGFLLLTVYWFNPVLWVAYILLCRDIEYACDESVIKQMGTDIKKPYSHALINCSISRRSIMACPLTFGEVNLRGRIKSVLNYKKPAFWVIVVSVILSIIVAICFLTNPAGIKITDIRDSGTYSNLFNNVEGITVTTADGQFMITQEDKIEEMVGVLKALRIKSDPVSQNRSEDRDMTNRITINGNTLCFNKDFTQLWILGREKPTFSYTLMDSDMAELMFFMRDSKNTTPITSEFNGVSDIYGLSISVKNIELETDNPYIEIEWKNETDKEYTYGEEFDFLYKQNSRFSSCATKLMYFHSIGYGLKPNETQTKVYYLSDFDLSRDGTYRFETKASLNSSDSQDYNLWIDFKLENQTEDEMRESADEVATQETKIKDLRKKYPQYFDLPTVNGLEIYVELLTLNPNFPTTSNCYLFSGNNLGYDYYDDLADLTGVGEDDMKLILSTYQDVASNEISIVVFNHPLSMYRVEIDTAYISRTKAKFGFYNEKLDPHMNFKATVLKVYEDGNILVEPFKNEPEGNISTQITLNLKNVTDTSLKVGDKVRIAYSGSIEEGFPAHISDVRAVLLIDNGIY